MDERAHYLYEKTYGLVATTFLGSTPLNVIESFDPQRDWEGFMNAVFRKLCFMKCTNPEDPKVEYFPTWRQLRRGLDDIFEGF